MLSIFFPSPFLLFCQIWLQERFQLLHPPIAPLSTYLPRHLRERRLQDILGFEAYRELMGCLKETDIQWVVEWWHILSMVQSCFKDHCVTLVGLRCYSTCHISRQFGEHQGAPDDEGAFHTTVFTNRILGKISEAWPHHGVTKDIVPPKYIYLTASYKQWLEDDMKWILKDEKANMKTSKKIRKTEWLPWYAQCFTFLHFCDSHIFVFEFNEGLKCSKSLMKANLLPFNLSKERISLFIIFAYCHLIYSFFFSFLFPLPCNFCPWCLLRNFGNTHVLFP